MRPGSRLTQLATCALFVLLSFAGSGCFLTHTKSSATPAKVDTLWYATARQRTNNHLASRLADSLEFGFYRISSRTNANLMRGDINLRIIDSARVTRAQFLQAVASPSSDSNNVVVLSVHGYATSHTKAIRDAAEAYVRSGTKARWVAFSWPSSGFGLNLMQTGHLFMTGAYRADSAAAVKSKPAFAGLVLALHAAVGGERLVITTHSLGAQLATEALAGDSVVRAPLTRNPLRAIGLFEPDLATSRLREYSGPKLRALTDRLALYASENDGMLRFSRVVNRSDRAGLIDDATPVIDGVETIDATNGVSSEDWFRRHFGTHHAMKKETSALRDFFDIVVAHRPANCRATRGTAQLTANGVWKLVPKAADAARC